MLEDYKEKQPEFYDYALKIIKNKKISHAYFIETSSFKDGKNLAKAFAKFLIIEDIKNKNLDFDIDNISRLIDNGTYKDLYIIDPDGQNIKKEQILDLKEEFSNKSLNNNLRVYIINDADKLNKSSANSMLKFLEEPEDDILGILVSENKYNVIKTILSRCQCFKLKSIESKISNFQVIKDMFDFVMNIERNGLKTICYINNLWTCKYSTKEDYFLNFDIISKIYMDSINYMFEKNLYYNINVDDLKYIIKNNSLDNILNKIKIINKYKDNLKYNLNSSLMMDKFIIDLVGGRNSD